MVCVVEFGVYDLVVLVGVEGYFEYVEFGVGFVG